MSTYRDKQLLEDIYDYLKVLVYNRNEITRGNDSFIKLSIQHAEDAKRGLHAFLFGKSIEWDPEKNTIKIGRNIILKLEII